MSLPVSFGMYKVCGNPISKTFQSMDQTKALKNKYMYICASDYGGARARLPRALILRCDSHPTSDTFKEKQEAIAASYKEIQILTVDN